MFELLFLAGLWLAVISAPRSDKAGDRDQSQVQPSPAMSDRRTPLPHRAVAPQTYEQRRNVARL